MGNVLGILIWMTFLCVIHCQDCGFLFEVRYKAIWQCCIERWLALICILTVPKRRRDMYFLQNSVSQLSMNYLTTVYNKCGKTYMGFFSKFKIKENTHVPVHLPWNPNVINSYWSKLWLSFLFSGKSFTVLKRWSLLCEKSLGLHLFQISLSVLEIV